LNNVQKLGPVTPGRKLDIEQRAIYTAPRVWRHTSGEDAGKW
jgi:hypothetical protein